MEEFVLQNDPARMNWVEGYIEWGTVRCAAPLRVETEQVREGDILRERYTFINETNREVFTKLTDIAIYATFNDDYTTARECMHHKCHTHIWCGGAVSYVMALRMGGEAPHLGLVLTEGALGGYSVERDLSRISNDRGDFLLHPAPFVLAPRERYTLAWTLFPHAGRASFLNTAKQYCAHFIDVRAEKYLLFIGEETTVTVDANFAFEHAALTLNGAPLPFTRSGSTLTAKIRADAPGEMRCAVVLDGVETFCELKALPPLPELAERRCRFIAEKQQFCRPSSGLDGAFLIYDNEEECQFYDPRYDYNAGRERVGMGLALAAYLQKWPDSTLEKALHRYADFVRRELVNPDTGEVYNDYHRDNSYKRLYNAPWYARLYIEFFNLWQKKEYLETACKILRFYYAEGGSQFYPIQMPVAELIPLLRSNGLTIQADALMAEFLHHADYLAANGTDYPALEVNYEQSIVAPAADILLQAYKLTGVQSYLVSARKQLDVLELFNGIQPSYHLREVAIRHWDGYWFGKRKLYGDTFPHYWSALTGLALRDWGRMTGDVASQQRGEDSLRAVLSLLDADGRAHCAYVYPITVNGASARGADPYANDQDWGLYFALKTL